MEAPADPLTPLDRLAGELQELRLAAGSPSYGEIANRVARQRAGRAAAAHDRPGRTTVYDVFKYGRRRVDIDLALEIVRALGGDDETVAAWAARYSEVLRESRSPRGAERRRGSDQVSPLSSSPAHGLVVSAPVLSPRSAETLVAPEDVAEVVPEPVAHRIGPRLRALVLVGCVVLNLVGHAAVIGLELPVYLDMVGTAVAAIALGPWSGAAVGVATNLGEAGMTGSTAIPFAIVNAAGALAWGYGMRLGLGRTLARFLGLNLLVAVLCTVLAVPIMVVLYDGHSVSSAMNDITGTYRRMGHDLLVSVSSMNLVTSIADKLISGFVAISIAELLPGVGRTWLRRGESG